MTDSEVYAALRPRGPRRLARIVRVLLVCSCLSWLGWCLASAVHAVAYAYAAAACAAAGQSWGGLTGSCDAPVVEFHIDAPPAPGPKSPLNGPGGA